MIQVSTSAEWSKAHRQSAIGLLQISGVSNRYPSQALNQHKRETEERLRRLYAGFNRKDLLALPLMAAYDKYYNRFDKTYHVLLQIESIVFKHKNLPDVSPLVDANFTAEVESLVLTAGHDVARLETHVVIDVSVMGDKITGMNGETRQIRPGDMVMRDARGVCCTILYGQDNRSPISAETEDVLYVAYAPPGVSPQAVEAHFQQVRQNVSLFAPQATVEQCRILVA